jgi:subtilisin family serine protease
MAWSNSLCFRRGCGVFQPGDREKRSRTESSPGNLIMSMSLTPSNTAFVFSFRMIVSRRRICLFAAGWILFCLWLLPATGFARIPSSAPVSPPAYREDQILIQPKRGVSPAALAGLHSARKGEVLQTFEGIGRLQIVRLPQGETVPGFIAKYEQSGLVEFAEPDYEVHAALAPNDPKYLDGTLWGLNNTGQNGGMAGADIDAPEGWDVLTSASNIVVAVLDSGIRYTHEDLASNMWVNPNDGGHGWNAFTGTNNPNDDNGHGTLVAGVLGAVGNNGKGVVGVACQVQMMACKCLDSSGSGSDSTLITCIDYARTNGAKIMNASLDSSGYSQAVSNAIVAIRDAGIIFVASCGNNAFNVDLNPRYPACYNIDNIVSVAYTTRNDTLGTYSNYGATNVDLAAPGAAMYSTFFISDSAYFGGNFLEGTSLAAPYVSGAFALMLAKYPTETYQQIISRVLNATDPLPALAGKCVTGGRLNLRNALSPPLSLTAGGNPFQLHLSAGPNRTCVIELSTNLAGWVSIYTNTASTNGTFDFTDDQSTNSVQRFYRASSSL